MSLITNSRVRSTPERGRALAALYARVRGRARVATTLCHGPRYLHSPGQLHEGGPDRGLIVDHEDAFHSMSLNSAGPA